MEVALRKRVSIGRPATDAELITRTRAGDDDAFAELYRRHEKAARSTAWCLTRSNVDTDDVVAEAFAQILSVLRRDRGPQEAFRPYLLTCIRNGCAARARQARLVSVDPAELQDAAADELDEFAVGVDAGLMAKAFFSLPERWQWVLWQTEVEGHAPSDVALQLDMAPGAVAALAYRARKALSEAYLEVHLAAHPAGRCRETVGHLPGYVRRSAPTKACRAVEAHLATCESCRAAEAELRDLNRSLREALVPAIAGIPLLSYVVARKATKVLRWAAGGKLVSGSVVATMAAFVSLPLLLPSAEPVAGATEVQSRPATRFASVAARAQPSTTLGTTNTVVRTADGQTIVRSADGSAGAGPGRAPTSTAAAGTIPSVSIDVPGLPTPASIGLTTVPSVTVAVGLSPGADLASLVSWLENTVSMSIGALPVQPLLAAIEELAARVPSVAAHVAVEPRAASVGIDVDDPLTGRVQASVSVSISSGLIARIGSVSRGPDVTSLPVQPPAPPTGSVPTTVVVVTRAPPTSSALAPPPTTAVSSTTASLVGQVSSVVSTLLPASTTSSLITP